MKALPSFLVFLELWRDGTRFLSICSEDFARLSLSTAHATRRRSGIFQCTPSRGSRPKVCQNCGQFLCASSHREKISRPTIVKYLCPPRNWRAPKALAISRGTIIFENGGTTYFFSVARCTKQFSTILANVGATFATGGNAK